MSTFAALSNRSLMIAHWCGAEEALHMLRALCAFSVFPVDLMCDLLRQVSKLPRSSLSDANDNALHQVCLSLLHEPNASDALAAVRAIPDLWDHCYQPEEVIGDCSDSTFR